MTFTIWLAMAASAVVLSLVNIVGRSLPERSPEVLSISGLVVPTCLRRRRDKAHGTFGECGDRQAGIDPEVG